MEPEKPRETKTFPESCTWAGTRIPELLDPRMIIPENP